MSKFTEVNPDKMQYNVSKEDIAKTYTRGKEQVQALFAKVMLQEAPLKQQQLAELASGVMDHVTFISLFFLEHLKTKDNAANLEAILQFNENPKIDKPEDLGKLFQQFDELVTVTPKILAATLNPETPRPSSKGPSNKRPG
jgi:hypothetical protein